MIRRRQLRQMLRLLLWMAMYRRAVAVLGVVKVHRNRGTQIFRQRLLLLMTLSLLLLLVERGVGSVRRTRNRRHVINTIMIGARVRNAFVGQRVARGVGRRSLGVLGVRRQARMGQGVSPGGVG